MELDKDWELTITFSKMGVFGGFERKEIIISSETQKAVNQGSIVGMVPGFCQNKFQVKLLSTSFFSFQPSSAGKLGLV